MKFRLIATAGKMIALIAVICMASCKKDSSSSNSNENSAATLTDSSTAADNAYYDVLNNAFIGFSDNINIWKAAKPHEGKTTTFSTEAVNGTTGMSCAIYSVDDSIPEEYPKTLTLDFGTGCTSADGIIRKGKISYLFSGPLLSPGTTAAVTFTNYVVNGYGVQGTYSITNNSSELNGISFTTTVSNGIITYPSEANYHYSHNKTYVMTAGSGTPFDISDDVYAVSGNSSFSVPGGNNIVFTTTTPLVKAVSCHNVSKGIVGFVYNENIKGTIDFGDGTCDALAVVTVGNIQKTITLR